MAEMPATRRLAEYVRAIDAAPLTDETREAALRCVLDLMAAAAAGAREKGVEATRAVARSEFGNGPAEIWFTSRRSSPAGAVLCNSAAASILDLDDGYRAARGHPGAAAIPAALAAAAECDADAASLLAGIAAGYEVGIRVAIARPAYAPSGAWSPFAAIAAAGAVRRTRVDALANAFGIAAQHAPALPGLAGLMGSDVKEGIPWGAASGMAALRLAEAGFTGPLGILDESALFSGARMFDGLGDRPLIGGTYFKPYACCRHLHAPLDAYAKLAEQHAIAPASVTGVEVHTYSGTFNLSNRAEPRDLVEAQYSTPFCIAILALKGREALLPMDAALLADPALRNFAGRVSLHRDPEIEPLFPAKSPARVVVHAGGMRFESPVTMPRGDPGDPLSWDELREKFLTATRLALAAEHQQAVLDAVDRMRSGDLRTLRAALCRPALS
jgi:2-methylcitrate dehydratase PrpD